MTISAIKGSDNIDYMLRDDVHVWGGRNLLGGTKNIEAPTASGNAVTQTFGSLGRYNSPASAFSLGVYNRICNAIVISETATGNRGIDWYTKPGVIVAGELYTFSCKIYSDVEIEVHTHTAWRNGSATANYTGWTLSGRQTILPEEWTKYSFTFTPAKSAQLDWEFLVAICFTGQTTGVTCKIAQAKLEHGNKATDWSPAPEDLAHVDGTELILFS